MTRSARRLTRSAQWLTALVLLLTTPAWADDDDSAGDDDDSAAVIEDSTWGWMCQSAPGAPVLSVLVLLALARRWTRATGRADRSEVAER